MIKITNIMLISSALTLSSCSTQQPPQVNAHLEQDQIMLELHNQARRTGLRCGASQPNPTLALTWSKQLAQAASNHSKAMRSRRKLKHQIQQSSTEQRIEATGYRWRRYGENIASGVFSAKDAFKVWVTSPQHCANIINPQFNEMGSAYDDGYWTVVFGSSQ